MFGYGEANLNTSESTYGTAACAVDLELAEALAPLVKTPEFVYTSGELGTMLESTEPIELCTRAGLTFTLEPVGGQEVVINHVTLGDPYLGKSIIYCCHRSFVPSTELFSVDNYQAPP